MQLDDRLATVLRSGAAGETGLRTQFRQLLDLLGTTQEGSDPALTGAAYARLDELMAAISPEEQARILREPGLRLRNPALIAKLVHGEAKPVAAAMATARLRDDQWTELIPTLPINARGFLRHRSDLPPGATDMLLRLGVGDLVLPDPGVDRSAFPLLRTKETGRDTPAAAARPDDTFLLSEAMEQALSESDDAESDEDGIRTLLRRIEAFRVSRGGPGPLEPPLPLGDSPLKRSLRRSETVDFEIDAEGLVTWADADVAPMLVGLAIAREGIADLAMEHRRLLRAHQPLRSVRFTLDRPEPIGGEWRLDAVPMFAHSGGAFTGYACRLRRPKFDTSGEEALVRASERVRQLLHELRTPVGAIQGFAEIIQQQLFGTVPNEYRALAATIAVDSARLLAGFEEIDRLARLESGDQALEEGRSDLRSVVGDTVRRLESAMRPRGAEFSLEVRGSPFTLPVEPGEMAGLVWRILATLAGAAGPGEKLSLDLQGDESGMVLVAQLPASLSAKDDLFAATAPEQTAQLRSGMFGTGFTLRLARAEAQSVGGSLTRDNALLTLRFAGLTAGQATHSTS